MSWHVVGDWGTTRLRLFRMMDGAVVERLEGPGIGALTDPPGVHLNRLLAQWAHHGRPDHVLLCGMAGARGALAEVPYTACPVDRAGWRAGTCSLDLDSLPVRIAPGVRAEDRDVMRGEETQIFGAMALDPALAQGRQLFILPGTHSKWVWTDNGSIADFRTWFTGELFGLLRDHSTLFKAKAEAGDAVDMVTGWEDGLGRVRQGGGPLGALFEARAAQLLRGRSLAWAEAYLSALLIGTEVEEGSRHHALPKAVVLIGAPALAERYERILADRAVVVRPMDGDRCVLAGLELLNDLD
ncbi:MAG TPA: 2-dehydro-3-deoxygalactonokinase [Sphingobium sp.]|uniref:2-dehydro-3-deoxygalactonokinase n=1 Tax=Sphingobium sp. TaxID=1912891 RepID=UPI002ECFFCF8